MKIPMNWITRFGILVLILGMASCASRSGLNAVNLSHVYQKEGLLVRPKIKIFHTTKYKSNIYFSFSSEELLYIRPSGNSDFEAQVDIQALVFADFDKKQLVDTAVITITDRQSELTPTTINGVIQIEINDNIPLETYVLQLRFHDKNRKHTFDEIRLIERLDPLNRQNFLVTDADSNIVYNDHIELNTPYYVFSNQEMDTLNVRYYEREFDNALPPFVTGEPKQFDFTADSTFKLLNGGMIQVDRPGFYHIQTDASTHEGYTLYHFYPKYPLVLRKSELIGPMRYITSNLEYEGIDLDSPDSAKIALDKFWITHAGQEDRARDQVQEYYQRVEAANIFFSSFKQGWRTDRGLLYVVYGPPTNIYRTIDTEVWVYGEEASSLNFTFVFDRMINPFTDNDFQLRRKNEYRYGWGMAIEEWRHGRIFDDEDIKRAQDERDQQQRQTAPPYLWY